LGFLFVARAFKPLQFGFLSRKLVATLPRVSRRRIAHVDRLAAVARRITIGNFASDLAFEDGECRE